MCQKRKPGSGLPCNARLVQQCDVEDMLPYMSQKRGGFGFWVQEVLGSMVSGTNRCGEIVQMSVDVQCTGLVVICTQCEGVCLQLAAAVLLLSRHCSLSVYTITTIPDCLYNRVVRAVQGCLLLAAC